MGHGPLMIVNQRADAKLVATPARLGLFYYPTAKTLLTRILTTCRPPNHRLVRYIQISTKQRSRIESDGYKSKSRRWSSVL